MSPLTEKQMLAQSLDAAANQSVTPPPVMPQPVPTMVTVSQVRAPNGQLMVVMQIATPTGVGVYFLDQAAARKIGADIQRQGSDGIVIAGADQIPQSHG